MTDERFKQWTDTIKNVNELLADYGKLDEHFRKISYDHYKLEEKNEKLILVEAGKVNSVQSLDLEN